MTTGWFINHLVMGKVMSILLLMSQNKTPETLLLVMSVLKKKQAFLGGVAFVGDKQHGHVVHVGAEQCGDGFVIHVGVGDVGLHYSLVVFVQLALYGKDVHYIHVML